MVEDSQRNTQLPTRPESYAEPEPEPELEMAEESPDEDARYRDFAQAQREDRLAQNKDSQAIQRVVDKSQEMFAAEDIELEEDDNKQLEIEVPFDPPFPIFMLAMAVTKDILDIPADLTVIGIIASTIYTLVFWIILFFWCHGRLSGKWWKKKLIKWLWTRYIATIIIEIIPGFQMIPTNIILVLMAHNHEKKIVKLFNLFLEELHASGLVKFPK